MKITLTAMILLFTAQSSLAASLNCYNRSGHRTYGAPSIKISTTKGFNNREFQKVTLSGYKLHDYFKEELTSNEIRAKDQWAGGGGRSHLTKVIDVQKVDLKAKTAYLRSAHGYGIEVFPDHGGIKIITTYKRLPTGKDWWFSYCYSL